MGIIAGLQAAVAAYGAGASFLSAAGVFFSSSIATRFLAYAAMQLAINALTPKPKVVSGYQVTSKGSALDRQVIYGKTKVYPVVVFDGTTGTENKVLHRVIAFAGHEIDSFERIYINDSYVDVSSIDGDGNVSSVIDADGNSSSRYNGKLKLFFHNGASDQLADGNLVSEVAEWTSDHRLRGIAYIYARFTFDQNVYPSGIPDISAVIKGKKVYDPRTATTAWSDNPALCIRDYWTDTAYGLGEGSDNIDDTLVATAANVCEFYNYPTLTGDARFTCNGAFTTGSEPYDILNTLASSMGGMLWYAQGKWRMKPAYWTSPVIDLSEDDLRSGITVSTRHSRRDNFNTVNGIFRGEESNWQETDFPPVTDSAFVTADGGQEKSADIKLPFTSDPHIARRIALIYLERNRQQLTIQATFGMRAFQVQVGDIVTLTNTRFGWSAKEFEVVSWTFSVSQEDGLVVQMSLREIAESVFDDISDGIVYERDNTTLLSPFTVPAPSLDAAVASTSVNQDGTTIPEISFSWSVVDSSIVDYFNFEWKLSSASTWNSISLDGNEFVLSPAISSAAYDYRIQSVNHLGVRSAYVSAPSPVSTGNDATTPNAPTSLSASGGYGSATVTWAAPTQNTDSSTLKDLFQYKIYRGLSSNPTTLVGRVSGEIFTDSGLNDSTTYYYRVKAVDFSGNESAYSANASVTTNPQLVDGTDGASVLVVYADDAAGNNQSLTAGSKQYVQYYEYTGTTPSLPVSGTFVKFVGDDGTTGQGIYPIYADDAAGNNQSFSSSGKTYVTFYEATSTPTLPVTGQTFVKFVGDDGAAAARGAGRWYVGVTTLPTTSSGADTDFTNAIGDPVDRDQAWFYTGTLQDPTSQSVWIYTASTDTWIEQNEIIDGNLVVAGTITADKLSVDKLDAITAELGQVNITDTLTLTAGGAGFIGGRTNASAYDVDGFLISRTDLGGGSKGFEVSHTSVYDTDKLSGIIHNQASRMKIFNPTFYIGGSTSGGYALTTSNTNVGRLSELVLTVQGGGGGGGYGVGNGSGTGYADSGTSTIVKIWAGSIGTGTQIGSTITASGGAGGANGAVDRNVPHDGQGTTFGVGGAGGGNNLDGSDAPVSSYGAGGGGGGGDAPGFLDPEGLAGLGGSAGQTVQATIDTSAYSTQDIWIEVVQLGQGGAGALSTTDGGNGANGVVAYASPLAGAIEVKGETLPTIEFISAIMNAGSGDLTWTSASSGTTAYDRLYVFDGMTTTVPSGEQWLGGTGRIVVQVGSEGSYPNTNNNQEWNERDAVISGTSVYRAYDTDNIYAPGMIFLGAGTYWDTNANITLVNARLLTGNKFPNLESLMEQYLLGFKDA